MDNTRVQFYDNRKYTTFTSMYALRSYIVKAEQPCAVCKIEIKNNEKEENVQQQLEKSSKYNNKKTRQAENGLKILLQYDARLYQWKENTCTQIHMKYTKKSTRIPTHCYFMLVRSIRSLYIYTLCCWHRYTYLLLQSPIS